MRKTQDLFPYKRRCVNIIFCHWQTTHLLPLSRMPCSWCWRQWARYSAGWVQGTHDRSWKSALGGWWLLCQRATVLLVWAINSSELGKWHILGFNFAGWSLCQDYSVSQNHRISKCVLIANWKINMPFSFSSSMTENALINRRLSVHFMEQCIRSWWAKLNRGEMRNLLSCRRRLSDRRSVPCT